MAKSRGKGTPAWFWVLLLVAAGVAVWWFFFRTRNYDAMGKPPDYSQLPACSAEALADEANEASQYEYSREGGVLLRRPKGQQVPWSGVCKVAAA